MFLLIAKLKKPKQIHSYIAKIEKKNM